MSILLYEHQQTCIDECREALKKNNSVLLQAPTGFGKTVVASYITQSAQNKGKSVWFICHRSELVFQTSQTFLKNDIEHSFIAANEKFNPRSDVFICSIDTLKNRIHKLKKPDLVIWDECQHLGAAGWSKVKLELDNAKHVGLSATPERLDGQGLGQYFDKMVKGPSVSWLIEKGYLSDYKLYCKPVSVEGVHTKYGDYKKKELESKVDKPTITGDIIQHWLRHSVGKKTICFAVTVEHSKHLSEQFRARGIKAAHLDGKTDRGIRKAACRDFANGHIDILCNVDLFGEGFDIAAQAGKNVSVECVIQARPTQSLSLHLQQVGRALRRKNTHAIILDHAGNCLRHGLPDDEREWSLDSKKRSKRKDDQEQLKPLRRCTECYNTHRPAPKCPDCGFVYKVQQREIIEEGGELIEIDKAALQKQRKQENKQAKTLEDLIKLGQARNYKDPVKWANIIHGYRQGGRQKYGN